MRISSDTFKWLKYLRVLDDTSVIEGSGNEQVVICESASEALLSGVRILQIVNAHSSSKVDCRPIPKLKSSKATTIDRIYYWNMLAHKIGSLGYDISYEERNLLVAGDPSTVAKIFEQVKIRIRQTGGLTATDLAAAIPKVRHGHEEQSNSLRKSTKDSPTPILSAPKNLPALRTRLRDEAHLLQTNIQQSLLARSEEQISTTFRSIRRKSKKNAFKPVLQPLRTNKWKTVNCATPFMITSNSNRGEDEVESSSSCTSLQSKKRKNITGGFEQNRMRDPLLAIADCLSVVTNSQQQQSHLSSSRKDFDATSPSIKLPGLNKDHLSATNQQIISSKSNTIPRRDLSVPEGRETRNDEVSRATESGLERNHNTTSVDGDHSNDHDHAADDNNVNVRIDNDFVNTAADNDDSDNNVAADVSTAGDDNAVIVVGVDNNTASATGSEDITATVGGVVAVEGSSSADDVVSSPDVINDDTTADNEDVAADGNTAVAGDENNDLVIASGEADGDSDGGTSDNDTAADGGNTALESNNNNVSAPDGNDVTVVVGDDSDNCAPSNHGADNVEDGADGDDDVDIDLPIQNDVSSTPDSNDTDTDGKNDIVRAAVVNKNNTAAESDNTAAGDDNDDTAGEGDNGDDNNITTDVDCDTAVGDDKNDVAGATDGNKDAASSDNTAAGGEAEGVSSGDNNQSAEDEADQSITEEVSKSNDLKHEDTATCDGNDQQREDASAIEPALNKMQDIRIPDNHQQETEDHLTQDYLSSVIKQVADDSNENIGGKVAVSGTPPGTPPALEPHETPEFWDDLSSSRKAAKALKKKKSPRRGL